MKILYHHRIGSRDGQSVHLDELIGAFRKAGHDVLIVGPESFARASFGDDAKNISKMKALIPGAIYELLELAYNIPAYFRLRKAFRSFRPDFIYERSNLYLLAGLWLKLRTGTPLLLEINSPLARERAEHGGLRLKNLATQLEAWTWRTADNALPVTGVLSEIVRAGGAAGDRVAVIANAIDPAVFSADAYDPCQAKRALGLIGKTVLGFTGFVREWHGLDRIIDALTLPPLHAVHLVIVGDGPVLADLKAQARAAGVSDRVAFAGLVERSKVGRYIAAFDIALQPKCVEYCSPLKLFEYMGLAKAIVAPDQRNIREVLENGVSALLFDSSQPAQLVNAIIRLAESPDLRIQLGAAARLAITQRGFTWERNAFRVAALAQRAIDKRGANGSAARPAAGE